MAGTEDRSPEAMARRYLALWQAQTRLVAQDDMLAEQARRWMKGREGGDANGHSADVAKAAGPASGDGDG